MATYPNPYVNLPKSSIYNSYYGKKNAREGGAPGVISTGYTKAKAGLQQGAMSKLAALDDEESAFQKGYSEREGALASKYASMRTGLDAGKQAMGSDMQRMLDRQAAAGGGAGGGAQAKMMTKGMSELGKQYGSLEAGLGAEEAGAREQLLGAKASERFAREEAIRSGKQFDETMAFQEGSFADQMRYSWAELDENQKTNIANVMALLKDSGLLDPGNKTKAYKGIYELYGPSRAPSSWKGPNWTPTSYYGG